MRQIGRMYLGARNLYLLDISSVERIRLEFSNVAYLLCGMYPYTLTAPTAQLGGAKLDFDS